MTSANEQTAARVHPMYAASWDYTCAHVYVRLFARPAGLRRAAFRRSRRWVIKYQFSGLGELWLAARRELEGVHWLRTSMCGEVREKQG